MGSDQSTESRHWRGVERVCRVRRVSAGAFSVERRSLLMCARIRIGLSTETWKRTGTGEESGKEPNSSTCRADCCGWVRSRGPVSGARVGRNLVRAYSEYGKIIGKKK